MRKATDFETLQVLHSLWRAGQIDVRGVKHMLLTVHRLHLTSLTNQGITADSLDGKNNYKIN